MIHGLERFIDKVSYGSIYQPFFYFFHYLFDTKFQEDNDVNQVNVESIENRQMPSYADVGRFLLKRNGKKYIHKIRYRHGPLLSYTYQISNI